MTDGRTFVILELLWRLKIKSDNLPGIRAVDLQIQLCLGLVGNGVVCSGRSDHSHDLLDQFNISLNVCVSVGNVLHGWEWSHGDGRRFLVRPSWQPLEQLFTDIRHEGRDQP